MSASSGASFAGRVLGIETSGISGSIALVEAGVVRTSREHHEENQHAERMLEHLRSALAELGWSKSSLEKIVVSRGPGAFTGIRMGIALAHGLELGLGIQSVGVSSLRALAASAFLGADGRLHEPHEAERVLAVRDARRGELFVGMFDAHFRPLSEPSIVPWQGAEEVLLRLLDGHVGWFVGAPCGSLTLPSAWVRAERRDPHAGAVALLGAAEGAVGPVSPEYLRGPNLIKPNLPPSPLRGGPE